MYYTGMGFYHNISNSYGVDTSRRLKLWAKTNIRQASDRNRVIFLIKCRRENIYPNHILDSAEKSLGTLQPTDGREADCIRTFHNRLRHRIINLEIDLAHRSVSRGDRLMTEIESEVVNTLPLHIWIEFKRRQSISYNIVFHRVKNTNIRKFNRLKTEQTVVINTEECWIKNLTDIDVPADIKNFLALGPKFSVSPTKKDFSLVGLLADIDCITKKANTNDRNLLIAQATNIVTNFINKDVHLNNHFNQTYKKTAKFLKEHPELMVTRADKGNVTVLLTPEQYNTSVEEILSDTNYYSPLQRDPTSTIQQKSNVLITNLKKDNHLDDLIAKKHMVYNPMAPRFYALPKIHKPTLSFRPIVSSINSPNGGVSKLITDILTSSYDNKNDYFVKDSFELAELLQDREIPHNYVLISLDVKSLFTNIPRDLAKSSIRNKWHNISRFTKIPIDRFLQLVDFMFDTTYFKFNGKLYKLIFGTPMGASASPIIAQYVMDELLDNCLQSLNFNVPMIKKYVDDIVCMIPSGKENEILSVFNNYNPHLQFTIETETNNSVPFLDTKLIRLNNKIILDWYIKPTSSGRYINFYSHHREKTKINLILGLKNRIHKISHHTLYNDNIKKLYNILLLNSYPSNLLKRLLFNNPATRDTTTIPRTSQNNNGDQENPLNTNQNTFAVLPYIQDVTARLMTIFRKYDVKFAVRNLMTMNGLFTKTKDKAETLEKSNVVYKIKCNNCTKVYIGQTSRSLKSRITSHRSDIRLKKNTCALAEHSIENDHQPNYEEVQVLDTHASYNKRCFLEMSRILQEPSSMNKRSDIAGLSTIYSFLIDKEKTLRNRHQ